MKRSSSRKLKSVSWAPGSNLSQVKFFSSEDCPSKVGKKSQDHLQAKTSSTTTEYDDYLPPGFEGNHFPNQSNAELALIPQIKWECPPLFAVSHAWCVAAGEESIEKYDQKLREMKVLEAVYPRTSAIPPRPYVSFDVEKECYDDSLTPLVTLIPIEEEEEAVEDIQPDVDADAEVTKHADSSTKKLQSQNLQQDIPSETSLVNSQCSGEPKPVATTYSEADIAAASALAVAAILKSNEIDMDLLVKIFNDSTIIEKLIEEHRTAATTVSTPTSYSKPSTSSVPLSSPAPNTTVGLLPASGPSLATPSVPLLTSTLVKPATAIATPPVYAKPAKTHSVAKPPPSASANMHASLKQVGSITAGAMTDVNSDKKVVGKSGTHTQDMERQGLKRPGTNIMKPEEVKFKIQKPCRYFKSSRGCRNGSNCRYLHDMSAGNVPMTQNAKRLKVRPETTWKM